jgi:septum formation inhibitor MinC
MPKPTKRAPVKSSSKKKTAKTASRAKPAKKAKKPATVSPADEAAYLEMLIRTGQAVPAGRALPAGATHVVVTDDKGTTKAVRRRFSIS